MHHAMTDGMNILNGFDFINARFFRTRPTQNKFDRRARVTKRRGRALRRFVFGLQCDDRFAADAFDDAVRQTRIGVSFD